MWTIGPVFLLGEEEYSSLGFPAIMKSPACEVVLLLHQELGRQVVPINFGGQRVYHQPEWRTVPEALGVINVVKNACPAIDAVRLRLVSVRPEVCVEPDSLRFQWGFPEAVEGPGDCIFHRASYIIQPLYVDREPMSPSSSRAGCVLAGLQHVSGKNLESAEVLRQGTLVCFAQLSEW